MDEIKYDYYSISLPHITEKSVFLPITAQETNESKNVISALYQGRVNQPNISYFHPKMGSINYQAAELFISKGQQIYPQDNYHDAELIILHKPTTNAPILYSCFLLKSNGDTLLKHKIQNTGIDEIIKQTQTSIQELGHHIYDRTVPAQTSIYNQELTLCMNNYITQSSPKMDIYEKYCKDGAPCIVVVFKEIINISTEINSPFSTISNVSGIWSSKEGYETKDTLVEDTLVEDNDDILNTLQQTKETLVESIPNILNKQTGIQDTKNTKDIKDDYLECEFLPGGIDSEDVKVYEIPIGSQVYTDGTSSDWISMVAKNVVVFMGAFIAFFVYPQIYNFFKKKLDDSPNLSWLSETKWTDVFIFKSIGSWYNLILTTIFLTNSIILFSIGTAFLSYSFVLSGLVIIFSYIFGYMGIGYLNSIQPSTLS